MAKRLNLTAVPLATCRTASLVEREKDEPLLETLSFEEIESLLE